MTTTPIADAELAAAVATSLCASGIDAMPDIDTDGTVWLTLVLDGHAGTVAWLDVADLSYAVTVHRDGTRRLIPGGPLAGMDRCDDGRCVAGQIVEWVLERRKAVSVSPEQEEDR